MATTPVSPDITDPIPYLLSNPQVVNTYTNTTVAYDVAIGGQPFFLETSDDSPYRRVTAQYRKQQIDQTREPGEQTLTGWWIRSQSTFHLGQGAKFFEPAQDESLRFQYTYSKGCDVWTKGQVTLLPTNFTTHYTTGEFNANGRPFQFTRSIRYNDTDAVLLADEYDIDKIDVDGTLTHFIDYNSGTSQPVYAICDDGTYAFWVTNVNVGGTWKATMFKKPLTGDSTTGHTYPTVTGDVTQMWQQTGLTITNAVLEYTKERIVACINNKVYEIAATATALPTAIYTHPIDDFVFTSITSSGAAIYVAGYSGIQSAIYKFTLTTAGAMPTLTSAITAAEMPTGETIFKIAYYLGYMAIGTSKGVRIAAVSDTDGSIAYGPLIFESEQPVYDVCFRDKFLWCATNVDGVPGLTRINLGQELSSLVFAYAWDLYDPTTTGFNTTACSFAGNTNQIIWVTDGSVATNGNIYIQDPSELVPTGYLRTGYVRYNTLENKIFKVLTPRFNTTNGSISILSVDSNDNYYTLGSYAQGSALGQVAISYPAGPQQFLAFEFTFNRSDIDSTKGPVFTGYQVNTLPAIPRQRLIQFPAMCYDWEMDKFNIQTGYDGSAYNRLKVMEGIEDAGDTITIQDFRTGETFSGLIEEMDFVNKTPTDKRYTGYGGVLLITIRKV